MSECQHKEIQERYCLDCNSILSQDDEIEELESALAAKDAVIGEKDKALLGLIRTHGQPCVDPTACQAVKFGESALALTLEGIQSELTSLREQLARFKCDGTNHRFKETSTFEVEGLQCGCGRYYQGDVKLREQLALAVGALEKFGQHGYTCNDKGEHRMDCPSNINRCDCGLDDTLAKLKRSGR